MTQGIVTEHLRSLITEQVEVHRLVIWSDPEGHYRDIAEDLGLPETTVARATTAASPART
ncbi:MAG: hypothetical protein JO252_11180 [Planctomycetaceae bacterium]|nr:hypothetical protein [Planctomycetaceae bacterium]MBV8315431.1 hypothetical protein [Planctomycetaceae bacterium]MBV8381552.1 hypothetical protein [Planctomycetaceae bacterium]MBV8610347.1 hypothetical protein [Singulisphaera sp.]